MPGTEAAEAQRQSLRFLWLYALAAAGGAVSYVPFLTLLLPVRVNEMSLNAAATIESLGYVAFAGAISASLANITFGWLSDLTKVRRPWILAGLLLSCILLLTVRRVDELPQLVMLIVCWQLALNMMLAPLAAWAGDVVPDAQKGFLGGLLSFAPAVGAASGALVTLPGLADADNRLVIVAALVAIMVLPVLLFGRPRAMPHLLPGNAVTQAELAAAVASKRGAVPRMWLARLLIQIAEALMFAYLLIWLTGIAPEVTDSDTARIFALVLILSVPIALAAGRWSDRSDRPILPLALGAAIGAVGLVIMGLAQSIPGAILGYMMFGLSSSVFLALHSSQTLRVLPKPETRGRDLGLFNLTNTVPSLIMPWLTIVLVPVFGFAGVFFVLAGLTLVATGLLITMPRPN